MREIQKSLSKESLDVWTPQKRVEGKVRASGRLDPSEMTSEIFQLLKKVREIQKSLSKESLDVWTPKKGLTIFSKF